jgi:gluconokinase
MTRQQGTETGTPRHVVVMGVAGSGKSTVAARLARATGALFIEGDLLHPPENVARMAGGEPLTDALREGWLDAIGRELVAANSREESAVAACSALKRIHRDRLRHAGVPLVFVYLDVSHETAARRVAGRKRHFMPASLVDSQFAALERPGDGEAAIILDGTLPVAKIVASIVTRLDAIARKGGSNAHP